VLRNMYSGKPWLTSSLRKSLIGATKLGSKSLKISGSEARRWWILSGTWLSQRVSGERKYWNYALVKKQLRKYLCSSQKNEQMARDIWKWMNLELWMREFIDRKYEQNSPKIIYSSKLNILPAWPTIKNK